MGENWLIPYLVTFPLLVFVAFGGTKLGWEPGAQALIAIAIGTAGLLIHHLLDQRQQRRQGPSGRSS